MVRVEMDDIILTIAVVLIFLVVVIVFPVRRYVRPRHATRKNKFTRNPYDEEDHSSVEQNVDNRQDFTTEMATELEPPLLDDSVKIAETASVPTSQNRPTRSVEQAELIIVFYVLAEDQSGFAGVDILTVLEALGLKYGEMKIFHHYGVGELKVKKAIFSVANVVEPGTIPLRQIEQFATSGLAFFMRLPGPFGGRVAFELMLNTIYQVAETLKGRIEDDKQQPLMSETINALRERIALFERR